MTQKRQSSNRNSHINKLVPLFFVILVLVLILIGVFFVFNMNLTSEPEVVAHEVEVDQAIFKLLLNDGESLTRELRVMNTGDGVKSISLSSGLGGILTFSESSFELSSGQTKVVSIIFDSIIEENNIEYIPGIYIGSVEIESEGDVETIPVVIEVESTEVLFDMNINFPDTTVDPGDEINPTVRLYNLMDQTAMSITMDYFVKDLDGNTFFSETETVVVDNQVSFTKTIEIPETFRVGTYVFGAVASYAGSTGTSSYVFDVVGEEEEEVVQASAGFCSSGNPSCWLIFFILALLFLFVLSYVVLYFRAYLHELVVLKPKEVYRRTVDKVKSKERFKLIHYLILVLFVLVIALIVYIFRADVSINLTALFSSVPVQIYFLILGIVIILVLSIIAHYSSKAISSFKKVLANMREKRVKSQILKLKKEKELKHLLERKRELKHRLKKRKRDSLVKGFFHFLGFFKTKDEIRKEATADKRRHQNELKDISVKLKFLREEKKLKEVRRRARIDGFKSIFRIFGLFKTPADLRREAVEESKKEKARLRKLSDKEKYLKDKRKLIMSRKRQKRKNIKNYFKSLFSIFGVYKKIYNAIRNPFVAWRKKRKLKQRWKEKKEAKEAKKHKTAFRIVPLFFVLLALILTLVGVLFVSNIGLSPGSDVSTSDLEIDQIMIKVLLNEQESLESEFRVMNTGDTTESVNLGSNFGEILSLSDTDFELTPGQTKVVTMQFNSAIDDIEYLPGIYIGSVDVDTVDSTDLLPVVVEVESSEVLFDMNINFPTVDVVPGMEINPTVRMYNLMDEDALSIDVEYFVKDLNGNSLYSETETVVVDSQVSFIKTIDFPADFRTGTYVFGAIASYVGSTGTSSYVFDVVEASPGLQSSFAFCSWTNPTCWLVGLIVILLFLFVLTYFIFFIQAYLRVIIPRRHSKKIESKKKSLRLRIKGFKKDCKSVNHALFMHIVKVFNPIKKWRAHSKKRKAKAEAEKKKDQLESKKLKQLKHVEEKEDALKKMMLEAKRKKAMRSFLSKAYAPVRRWYVGWKKRMAKASFERKKELLERKRLKELKGVEEKEIVLKQKMLEEREKSREESDKKKAELLEEKKVKKEKKENERQERLEKLKQERFAIREERRRRKEERKRRRIEEKARRKAEKERIKIAKKEMREEKDKERRELKEKKEEEQRKLREEKVEEIKEIKEEKEKEIIKLKEEKAEEKREIKEEREKEREEKEKERKEKEEKKEKVRLDMEAAKKREEEKKKARFDALKRKERRKKAVKKFRRDVRNSIIGAYVGIGKKYREMQREKERKEKEAKIQRRKEEEEKRRLVIQKQKEEDERRLQNMIIDQKGRLEELENKFEDEKRRDIERLTSLKLKMDTEKRKFVNKIEFERESMMGGSKRNVFSNVKKNFENYSNKRKFEQKQGDIKKKFAVRQDGLKSKISKEDSEINEIKKKLRFFKK